MQILPPDNSLTSLPCVDTDEIAFAMALFDAAFIGRVHAPDIEDSGFTLQESLRETPEDQLEAEEGATPSQALSSDLVGLSRAISVLWHHYQGDDRQRTIWSRVVAFQAMMVRRNGGLVERWAQTAQQGEGVGFQNPAVVNAVAVEPLVEFGQFNPATFQATVEHFTHVFPLASASELPNHETTFQFRIAESLLRPVENITGRGSAESLLSRALAISRPDLPWLRSVEFQENGRLMGIPSTKQMPDATQIAAGEITLIRSLIGLLRNIVGKSVTLSLMKSLCCDSLLESCLEGTSDQDGVGMKLIPSS